MTARLLRASIEYLPALLLALALIVPAHAADSFVLPDPSDFTLFALGLAGLAIGRHVARKRPRD